MNGDNKWSHFCRNSEEDSVTWTTKQESLTSSLPNACYAMHPDGNSLCARPRFNDGNFYKKRRQCFPGWKNSPFELPEAKFCLRRCGKTNIGEVLFCDQHRSRCSSKRFSNKISDDKGLCEVHSRSYQGCHRYAVPDNLCRVHCHCCVEHYRGPRAGNLDFFLGHVCKIRRCSPVAKYDRLCLRHISCDIEGCENGKHKGKPFCHEHCFEGSASNPALLESSMYSPPTLYT